MATGPDEFGGGLTGVQSNGTTDYEAFFQSQSNIDGQDIQLDNVKFITAAGGGTTVVGNVSNGDPIAGQNDGQFLFHTGLIADETVETLNFQWTVVNSGDSLTGGFQQIGGYIGMGDQDNYLKVVSSASSFGEINVVLEADGVVVEDVHFQADGLLDVAAEDGRDIIIDLSVDTATGIATPTVTYETADGELVTVDTEGFDISDMDILDALMGEHEVAGQTSGLAVGLFSTNNGVGSNDTFQAVFKDLEVTSTGLEGDMVFRVNAGGDAIAATDDGPDWAADTSTNPSAFLLGAGSNNTAAFNVTPNTSVSDDVPAGIFQTEHWDQNSGNEMEYAFDVADGTYRVNLFMGNGFGGTDQAGERVFDVAIEGNVSANLDDIDLSGNLGHLQGGVFSQVVEVSDGQLNIEFLHGVENPLINGIEIERLTDDETPTEPTTPIEVSIVTGDQTVSEGAGDVNVSILTSETVPVGEQIEIAFTIQGISATAGEDFEPSSALEGSGAPVFEGTAIIPGGSFDFQLSIDILDDALIEGNEELVVTLTGVSEGASIGEATSRITIEDNGVGDNEALVVFAGLDDVDTNATNGWDVGGVSGSELIRSSFTIFFEDGSTATGYPFDLQTVDVTIPASGIVTLPADAFDYVGTQSGVAFEGSDTAPLAFSAAVISPVSDNSTDRLAGDEQVAVGPVTEPIYLTSNGVPVGSVDPTPEPEPMPEPEEGAELIANGDFEDHGDLAR